jgi:DNA polymerase III alpha subunit
VKNLSNLTDQINKPTILSESYIAVINEINERTSKNGKRFCFFSLADDTAQIDAICFSEVLESLNFDLKKGKVYNFKISVQIKNDNSRFIINNIKDLNNEINQVQNYLVKMDTKDLNIKKVYNFFKNCDVGNSKLSFIIKFNDYEIFVESKKKFDLDYDFLNKVSNIKGILINKDNKIS